MKTFQHFIFQVSSWLCRGVLPAPGPLPHGRPQVPERRHMHRGPATRSGPQLPVHLPSGIQKLPVRDAGVERVQQLPLPAWGHLPLVHLEQLHLHLPKRMAGETLHWTWQLCNQPLQKRCQLHLSAGTICLQMHLSRRIHGPWLQHQCEWVRRAQWEAKSLPAWKMCGPIWRLQVQLRRWVDWQALLRPLHPLPPQPLPEWRTMRSDWSLRIPVSLSLRWVRPEVKKKLKAKNWHLS